MFLSLIGELSKNKEAQMTVKEKEVWKDFQTLKTAAQKSGRKFYIFKMNVVEGMIKKTFISSDEKPINEAETEDLIETMIDWAEILGVDQLNSIGWVNMTSGEQAVNASEESQDNTESEEKAVRLPSADDLMADMEALKNKAMELRTGIAFEAYIPGTRMFTLSKLSTLEKILRAEVRCGNLTPETVRNIVSCGATLGVKLRSKMP